MRDLTDLAIYKELVALSQSLERMAARAMSPASETALRAAAQALRKLASAVFKRGL